MPLASLSGITYVLRLHEKHQRSAEGRESISLTLTPTPTPTLTLTLTLTPYSSLLSSLPVLGLEEAKYSIKHVELRRSLKSALESQPCSRTHWNNEGCICPHFSLAAEAFLAEYGWSMMELEYGSGNRTRYSIATYIRSTL